MEPILAWALLAIVTERAIEIISKMFPILNRIKIVELDIKLVLSFIIGLVLVFGAELVFFDMFNIHFIIPYVGQILSAIFVAAGSNYIHDLIGAVNKIRQEDAPPS